MKLSFLVILRLNNVTLPCFSFTAQPAEFLLTQEPSLTSTSGQPHWVGSHVSCILTSKTLDLSQLTGKHSNNTFWEFLLLLRLNWVYDLANFSPFGLVSWQQSFYKGLVGWLFLNLVPRVFLRRGEDGRPSSPRRRKTLGTRLGCFSLFGAIRTFDKSDQLYINGWK